MENNIRVQRAIKRISQEELAEALKLHKMTIYNLENKRHVPGAVIMLKIARYFGKPVEEIFSLEEGD